ncbi:hypothetical protein MJO28_010892, partial [Puccinia striiformis f. sp. tritici]
MNTVQLSNKLRRCLSRGAAYHNQLQLPINQCVFDTADKKLKAALESSLGVMSHTTRRILSDKLQSVQSAHEKLLISWQPGSFLAVHCRPSGWFWRSSSTDIHPTISDDADISGELGMFPQKMRHNLRQMYLDAFSISYP